jgi:hypothetical protein
MSGFEHHQKLDRQDVWLKVDEQPMALLFISHRWDNPAHPDLSGLQIHTLQSVLQRTCSAVRALFSDQAQRLFLMPVLEREGSLQAEELARRILGFGPFSDNHSVRLTNSRRKEIIDNVYALESDAFDLWMLGKIGVWIDYCCIPQAPRTAAEQAYFDDNLLNLDILLASSTVIALRREGDDYSERAWCVSEIWLGAQQSFTRSLFVDMDRLKSDQSVKLPSSPFATDQQALDILNDGFESDLAVFQEAVARWRSTPGSLAETPPDAWAAYRSLQGSGFFGQVDDPNPARRGVEAVRSLSIAMIGQWWMSEKKVTLDLTAMIEEIMTQHDLHTTDPTDQIYLGLLLSGNGWIRELRPFFRACLEVYIQNHNMLEVALIPLQLELRNLLTRIGPNSPAIWFSLLSSETGHSKDEKVTLKALRQGLTDYPLNYQLSAHSYRQY